MNARAGFFSKRPDALGSQNLRALAGPVLIWEDARREYGENRFRAVGETDGDILHVVFTWRGDAVRIISVRRANRRETELWLRLK